MSHPREPGVVPASRWAVVAVKPGQVHRCVLIERMYLQDGVLMADGGLLKFDIRLRGPLKGHVEAQMRRFFGAARMSRGADDLIGITEGQLLLLIDKATEFLEADVVENPVWRMPA